MLLYALAVVIVSWTNPTTDLNGQPLPDDTWILVEQWIGQCPGDFLIDGKGVLIQSGTTELQFTETTGPFCYVVQAAVTPDDWHVSQPVEVGHTSGTCGNTCH